MKSIFLLVFEIILFSSIVKGQEREFSIGLIYQNKINNDLIKKKNDIESLGLKGKVKQFEYHCFSAKRKGSEIIKGNEIESAFLVKFDNFGKMVEMIEDYSNKSNMLITEYKYDDKGNISIENFYRAGKKLSESNTYTYKYNKKRIATEAKVLSSHGYSAILNFDDNGNLIEGIFFKQNGKLGLKYNCKMDDKRNPIEENWYNPNGKLVNRTTKKFNSEGTLIEVKKFGSNGKLESKETVNEPTSNEMTFNYSDSKNTKSKETHIEEYDIEGNVKKQTVYIDSDSPSMLRIWAYEYFE